MQTEWWIEVYEFSYNWLNDIILIMRFLHWIAVYDGSSSLSLFFDCLASMSFLGRWKTVDPMALIKITGKILWRLLSISTPMITIERNENTCFSNFSHKIIKYFVFSLPSVNAIGSELIVREKDWLSKNPDSPNKNTKESRVELPISMKEMTMFITNITLIKNSDQPLQNLNKN